MEKVTCEICGEQFESSRQNPYGYRCKICSGFLSVLDKGPIQRTSNENDEKFGMVLIYLLKEGKLSDDFTRGLIKGIRKI